MSKILEILDCIKYTGYSPEYLKTPYTYLSNACSEVQTDQVKSSEKDKRFKEIVVSKNVDILELKILIKHHNDRMALKLYNRQYKKDWQLTQDEFNFLKEMCNIE